MQQPTRTIKGTHHHYTIAHLIGQGQFGKVYKGTNTHTQLPVAIKAIRRTKFARNDKLKQLLYR